MAGRGGGPSPAALASGTHGGAARLQESGSERWRGSAEATQRWTAGEPSLSPDSLGPERAPCLPPRGWHGCVPCPPAVSRGRPGPSTAHSPPPQAIFKTSFPQKWGGSFRREWVPSWAGRSDIVACHPTGLAGGRTGRGRVTSSRGLAVSSHPPWGLGGVLRGTEPGGGADGPPPRLLLPEAGADAAGQAPDPDDEPGELGSRWSHSGVRPGPPCWACSAWEWQRMKSRMFCPGLPPASCPLSSSSPYTLDVTP